MGHKSSELSFCSCGEWEHSLGAGCAVGSCGEHQNGDSLGWFGKAALSLLVPQRLWGCRVPTHILGKFKSKSKFSLGNLELSGRECWVGLGGYPCVGLEEAGESLQECLSLFHLKQKYIFTPKNVSFSSPKSFF